MVKKRSRNGEFLACSGYPECKNTKSFSGAKTQLQVVEDVKCSKCGGDILERMSRRGKFYGCSNYPKCDFIANFLPTRYTCSKCNGIMLKRTFRKKPILECIACKDRIDDKEG